LIDILQIHHTTKAPPTYNRGNTRLDYILISHRIAPAVLRSGILPFYSLFLSDHRPCYIDIDATVLFQESTHQIAPMSNRGLQLLDPRKTTKYIDQCKDQLQYHRITEKVRALQERASGDNWQGHLDQEEYEKIDRLDGEIMLRAEKKLTRNYSKQYDWSPAIAQAINRVHYWRLRLKRSKGLLVSEVVLLTKRTLAHISEDVSKITTRQDILQQLRSAIEDRREKRKSHAELCQNYLLDLAEALVIKRDPTLAEPRKATQLRKKKAKQIKALAKREKKNRMFKKINYSLTKLHDNKGGLIRLDVPASHPLEPYPVGPDPRTWEGPWLTIT
jgi:hypothetical protein